ncbi:hypothetical protein B5F08_11725 [Anaeromassilibacillus sp. An172]|uniref:radical SAM protein n=1 Tax=Anaeromassilibacillus sp. An172 TaxID=1965570 RepID=UPI000B39A185|nr:radical SAM protein [Anaeromassilibacillus sp. An172]OUP74837.1 hypothetical protein B5F08_11725 [Anaeromassilibacillus sp. An172]
MSNVYYFNVNYCCNNNCEFCLSHNTYNATGQNYDIKKLSELSYDFNKSRIIINGGEPTLYKDLNKFIDFFKGSNAEIVMYSNGRLFSDFDYAKNVVSAGVSRITIPLHGTRYIHNKITGVDSYDETISAFKNLIKLKKDYALTIELKLILNNEIIKNKLTCAQLLKDIDIDGIDNIVVSRVIETEKYKPKLDNYIIIFANDIIRYAGNKCVKIEDFNLCQFFTNEIPYITDLESFDEFYFFDAKTPNGEKDNYEKKTHCDKRGSHPLCEYCNSIMDNYYIICKKGNKWFKIME